MLEDYLNQSAELQHKTGTNQRGNPVFDDILTIQCRLQKKYTLIQKLDGETISAGHICYLVDEVKTGDKINGLTVLAVNSMVNLNGEIIGYKAVM
ncbi:MAG: hypothetical protein K2G63_03370 [Oscillospiraceae bacterium]|nr:hypothetical protein [Oscillospiraceae bacterium]